MTVPERFIPFRSFLSQGLERFQRVYSAIYVDVSGIAWGSEEVLKEIILEAKVLNLWKENGSEL